MFKKFLSAVVVVVAISCGTAYAALTNGSYETTPIGTETIQNGWQIFNLATQGTQAELSSPVAAEDGTRMIRLNSTVASAYNGVFTDYFSYTPGTDLNCSGWYYLVNAIPASNYTRMQVQFYNSDNTDIEDDIGTNVTATGGWFQDTFTARCDLVAAVKYRFTVIAGRDANPTDITNAIYWDNVNAPGTVPEPSMFVLFGVGLAGMIGAGIKRFKKS